MVPSDWEIKQLDNVFKVYDSLHKTPTFSDDGYSMVRVTDIKGGYLDLSNTIKVSPEVFAEFTKKYKPKASDIVFSRVGSYGISSYAATDTPFCLGQNTVIAESNSSADSLYIFNVLKGQYVKRQIERTVDGSSHKTVSLKIIRNLAIPIPPLPEQRKIAKILSTWDKAISTTERLIDNSKQQKKALMQQLLTGKKRLLDDSGKPFEGIWSKVELGKLLDYKQPTPYLVKSTDYSDEYSTPVLTAGKTFILGYTNEDFGIFEEELPAIIFDDFTTASKFVDFPFKAKSSAMKILVAKQGISIKFVYEAMQVMNYPVGGHQRHWISIFANLVIGLPSLSEQQKIASVLSNADKEIELLEQQLADLKQEKKALMQQLLTGKRRVKMDDKEVA